MSAHHPVDPIAETQRQWVLHGWDDAADGMVAVASIVRAHQLLIGRIEQALRPFDLSFARYELLALLSFTREGRMPMASATARLQVHPTSVTNTVDRLERDGFVRRDTHPDDGRAIMLVVTADGRRICELSSDALNREVLDRPGMSRDDLRQLIDILARFREASGDYVVPLSDS